MPPPPSYLDLTAFPYSRVITQAEFNGGTFGGVANEVWFRFVTTTQIAFGGFATKGGTFVGRTTLYASDGTTVLANIGLVAGNPDSWYRVLAAGTYYVKVFRNGGGPSDFDFTALFDTRPVLTSPPPSGSIIVNDDTNGFPAIVLDRTTGVVLGVLTQIASGETASIFPTGESIWHHNGFPFGLSLYDTTLSLITNALDDHAVSEAALTRDNTDFYFFYGNFIDKITKAGIITTIPASVGIAQNIIAAVAVNADATVLYYTTGNNGFANPPNDGKIKRWDLVNNIALSDFYVIVGFNGAAGDKLGLSGNNNDHGQLLLLSDGTFVTHAYSAATDQFSIYHLSAIGALLHKYDYPGYAFNTYGIIDHLATDGTSTTQICVWFFKDNNGEEARFAFVNLNTGVLTIVTDTDMFAAGNNLHGNSPIIFAPSNSCIHVIYTIAAPPPPIPNAGSGIYKVVPGKRQDTLWDEDFTGSHDVKIPNPFAKSALLGE